MLQSTLKKTSDDAKYCLKSTNISKSFMKMTYMQ